MSIEIKVPVLPESVADATVAAWHKKVGDTVKRNENLVDIETDKVVLEVVAPEDGVLEKILFQTGSTVTGEQVIAHFKPGAVGAATTAAPVSAPPASAATPTAVSTPAPAAAAVVAGPAVRRMIQEQAVPVEAIVPSGKGGRILKEDVARALPTKMGARTEKRVPMTRLRARIAERLLDAQKTAAILTTFNEVNMQPVMDLRQRYKDAFEKQHGVRLGFMSFFAKAVVEALKRFPMVNASIDGQDIVYHGYYDIGVAVSSPRGLVVPVLRDVQNQSMADVERNITDFGRRASEGALTLEEMTGGTFTISNGGVFGSLLSTPILNPPQSAILGMHKIQERPVVEKGAVVVRPMMYLALSYDHRIIDGAESVRFLVTIKDLIEDPARLLLEV